MATALESLTAARDSIAAAYAAVAAQSATKPDYTIDGRTYNWSTHLKNLGEELDAINGRIDAMGNDGIFIISGVET